MLFLKNKGTIKKSKKKKKDEENLGAIKYVL